MNPIIQEDIANIAQGLGAPAEKLAGSSLLMSGAAGFLGSYMVATIDYLNRTVLTKPCRVIAIDNFITGSRVGLLGEIESKEIVRVEADITKPLAIREQIDYIVHAAGLASPVYYRKYPLETIDVTITGTRNLLELARHGSAKSFLLFSSSEIYGDPDPRFIPTPETYRGNVSSIGPRACYDESKRLAETISMIYYEFFGVPIKIVRPFNVYGPLMKPNDHRVIPSFLTHAMRGEPLPVHDRGSQTRTYCYISDAITGFLKILLSEKNGEVYNVGNDQNELSVKTLAGMVAELFDKKVAMQLINYPDAYPADEPQRRCPDLEKIRYELQYGPRVDVKTGLARTLAWFKAAFPLETLASASLTDRALGPALTHSKGRNALPKPRESLM